jgi:SAM-dependent methyltransferase
VKEVYDRLDRDSLEKGILPMHSTQDGFWGSSNIDIVYDFFVKVGLEKYKRFLDLGSGDGRIVLLASIFTDATGAETDQELFERAVKIRDSLGLKAEFLKKNYLDINFEDYDFIYVYPDKRFSPELEKKLKKELKGKLFVYSSVYLPYFLKKGKTWWVDQYPTIEYTR